MIRHRLAALLALASVLATVGPARQAFAAAEIHRLNLVLTGSPTSVDGGDFNEAVDYINRVGLTPFGLEELDKIRFAWLFQAELRYFVRPNFALTAGVGQLRQQTKREFLPAIGQSVQLRGEILSVPVHVGADYYFSPYNQGDFRAQAYFGGGFLSQVYNKAMFEQVTTFPDSAGPPRFKTAYTQDAPGFFVEGGVHMFFAARYSILIGAVYRNAEIREMVDRRTGAPAYSPNGEPFTLDLSGFGARAGIAIGF